jgi:5'-deoxynucleotidase YfbR-like HD superfamily hydrolase
MGAFMKHLRHRFGRGAVAAVVSLALPLTASADPGYDALKAKVEALQKQLEQVQEALKQYKEESASSRELAQIKDKVAEVSERTAEWRNADSVVHLAGYGDATYSTKNTETALFPALGSTRSFTISTRT